MTIIVNAAPQVAPLFSPFVVQREQIEFKVFTKETFEKLLNVFKESEKELRSGHSDPSAVFDSLYEFRLGPTFYSGPSLEDFKKHYEGEYRADFIRLVHATRQGIAPANGKPPVVAYISIAIDRNGGHVEVSGKSDAWALGVLQQFKKVLATFPTKHNILHSEYFEMVVQLVAAVSVTVGAAAIANATASYLSVKFSEVYVFAVSFILLSNLWGAAAKAMKALRDSLYPKVDIRKELRPYYVASSVLGLLSIIGAWAVKKILDWIVVAA